MASRNGVHSNTERPALALVEPQATASGLVLANELSATAAQQLCHGDEHSIRQILVNVLTNAIKFTSTRDGHAGHIPVSAGAANQPPPEAALDGPGPWVYVRVEDTGCGIPADQLGAILDAFVQVDADPYVRVSRGRSRSGDQPPIGAPHGWRSCRAEHTGCRVYVLALARRGALTNFLSFNRPYQRIRPTGT